MSCCHTMQPKIWLRQGGVPATVSRVAIPNTAMITFSLPGISLRRPALISESDHYGLHSYYCCFPDRHSSARAETTSVGTHPIPRLSVTPHFGHRRTGPVGFLLIQPTVSIGVGGKAQWHMANPSPFAICASAMANCSSDRSSAFPTSAALSAGNGSGCYLYSVC